MKILVDTNVIIDALAAREPFREDAEAILLLAAEEQITGFVTGSSITLSGTNSNYSCPMLKRWTRYGC